MAFPQRVYLRELGPREGFQTLPHAVDTASKLELIKLLSECGLPEIEITSFVRPDRVPQMADAKEVAQKFERRSGIKYTALYLNERGFLRAEESGRLMNDGWIYLAASETFFKNNNNTTIAAALAEIPAWLSLFSKHGKKLRGVMVSAAFGCNFEGVVPHEKVLQILAEAFAHFKRAGVTPEEISLADTMGWATPVKLRSLVEKVRKAHAGSTVSLHLHDTRGSGMANVYAGLEEGVSIFDCSIGGMGGCPFAKGAAGNVPTEDVAFLCAELGIETGVSLDKLVSAARYAEQCAKAALPGKLYKSWAHRKQ